MKISLTVVGKTSKQQLVDAIDDYKTRISHYIPFEISYITDAKNTKNLSPDQQKLAEGQSILAKIDKSDTVILLDEHGQEMTSINFAKFVEKLTASGTKKIVFLVGGPYGFSDSVQQRANSKISLSKMTFPHDLVRLIFVEQLYRALTILNNEPYHHE